MNPQNLTTPFAFRAAPCEDPRVCGGPQRHDAAYRSYLDVMRQAGIAGPEVLQSVIMGATRVNPELQRQLSMDMNVFIHLGMMPSDPLIVHGGSGGGGGHHRGMGAGRHFAAMGGRHGPSRMGGGFHQDPRLSGLGPFGEPGDFSHPQNVGQDYGGQGDFCPNDPRSRGRARPGEPHHGSSNSFPWSRYDYAGEYAKLSRERQN